MRSRSPGRLLTSAVVGASLLALGLAAAFTVFLVLGRMPKPAERPVFAWFTVATVVAVLIAPVVSRRGRGFASRRMGRGRAGALDPVGSFRAHMSRALPLDELMQQAVENLRSSMGASSAEIWVVTGDSLRLRVADPETQRPSMVLGTAESDAIVHAGLSGPGWLSVWMPAVLAGRNAEVRLAPIAFAGEPLGALIIERSEPTFNEQEERVLIELARQVGVTMHNAKLDSALHDSLDEVRRQAAELQDSRARIVAAGDQARRAIERNLHDGAQQHIVALAIKVGLIKKVSEKDSAKASELLDQLSGDINVALQELRDLAHGIYPPLLADMGLVEALQGSARKAALPVQIEAAGIGRYDPELEATVYFCCLEAIQNASKYAGAGATAVVTLTEERGALIIVVTDNGAGFEVRGKAMGMGLTNMNDRIGAVGGTLRVESAPGKGTKLTAVIPIPQSQHPTDGR